MWRLSFDCSYHDEVMWKIQKDTDKVLLSRYPHLVYVIVVYF